MSNSELDVMKSIDDALSGLDTEACNRVLTWVLSKYDQTSIAPTSPVAQKSAAKSKKKPISPPLSGKSSKKKSGKTSFSIDKTLHLFPADKVSIKDFAKEKAPGSHKEKCVVAVYYLQQVLEVEATIDKVYTCFKAAQWPIPTNLKNTLSQTGSAALLDTADFEDIKLTSIGENLVEHDLPKIAGT